MTLKEYLLKEPDSNIALMWFDENGKGRLQCKEYSLNEFDKIEDKFLQMEFMECNDEEDCKEIWIR